MYPPVISHGNLIKLRILSTGIVIEIHLIRIVEH